MLGTIVLFGVGLLFAMLGGLFLSGSLRRDPRWSKEPNEVRVVAVLTGLAWLALGVGLIAAAWTSGSTSRNLVIAGGLVAVGCEVARRLVRRRWERRTVGDRVEQNRGVEP